MALPVMALSTKPDGWSLIPGDQMVEGTHFHLLSFDLHLSTVPRTQTQNK